MSGTQMFYKMRYMAATRMLVFDFAYCEIIYFNPTAEAAVELSNYR